MKRLRRYLVAGLLVWIPIGITLFFISLIIRLMNQSLVLLALLPEEWRGLAIPGLGIVLTLAVLFTTGLFAANFVGHTLIGYWESILERIPFIRSVYSGAKKFSEIVLSESSQSFKKVLLIEYPRKGVYSLAFQSGSELGEVQARTGEEVTCCFVPTTPNPTSGFIVLVPADEIIELDMPVDAAIKMIVSLGVVVPTWTPNQFQELPLKMPPTEPAKL